MPSDAETAQLILLLSTGALSLVALFYLFAKHVGGQPLVPYQARRRVPWGTAVGLATLLIPLFGILTSLFFNPTVKSSHIDQPNIEVADSNDVDSNNITKSEVPEADQPEESASAEKESLKLTWMAPLSQLLLLFLIFGSVAFVFETNADDLGLPTSWQQATSDIGLGLLACFASFLPAYIIQFTLLLFTELIYQEPPTMHPLVEQLQESPSASALLVAFVLAVIAAPLFEEFLFRVLFQGWLERAEDESIQHQATERTLSSPQSVVSNATDTCQKIDAPDNLDTVLSIEAPVRPIATRPEDNLPLHGWSSALPCGWGPIFISATIFGLAHLGQGVAPIPLILFGVVLGYLYQRTHRILPSIVAHMTFNAYTTLHLGILVYYGPEN